MVLPGKKRMYCPHCGRHADILKEADLSIYCGNCYMVDFDRCQPMTSIQPTELKPL
jgi:hypothetical protein